MAAKMAVFKQITFSITSYFELTVLSIDFCSKLIEPVFSNKKFISSSANCTVGLQTMLLELVNFDKKKTVFANFAFREISTSKDLK